MKNTIFATMLVALMVVAFTACKHNDPEPEPKYGTMKIQVQHEFNGQSWELDKKYIHPTTGEELSFNLLKYYVSNIKVQDAEGNWWSEPNSYHLLCTDCAESGMITISGVPEGQYIAFEYTMGVDSAMNVSGVYDGDLSLGNGMFWDWNTGFIMLKAEGESTNSSNGVFAYHLGGFAGSENIVTEKGVSFNDTKLIIKEEKTPTIILKADVASLWKYVPGVATRSTVHMPGQAAVDMARGFYGDITFSSIAN